MGFCPSKENSNSQGTSVISVRPFFISIHTQHSHIQNQMKPRKGPSGWSDAPRRDRNANMTGAYTTGLGARSHSIKSPPTGPASERTSWDTGQWYKDSQKSGQSDAGPSTSTQAGASATTWGTTPDWAKSPLSGLTSPRAMALRPRGGVERRTRKAHGTRREAGVAQTKSTRQQALGALAGELQMPG